MKQEIKTLVALAQAFHESPNQRRIREGIRKIEQNAAAIRSFHRSWRPSQHVTRRSLEESEQSILAIWVAARLITHGGKYAQLAQARKS